MKYSPPSLFCLPTPHPSSSADEIKDDFDTLGSDATLQAVGNGTGECLQRVLAASRPQSVAHKERIMAGVFEDKETHKTAQPC